ncbi:hypothetical protein [Sapientia aquatica]|uniref:Uncharacterized protein n=1 Tax=Sapientia aquatica TaxID=1549640 RepID=A0A4R5W2K2_9BURK|nr:hypothetical protein [Sapientia aquatica]TDK65997.1 hypothetical protein E2I14_10415 [Sapientia aquatica]
MIPVTYIKRNAAALEKQYNKSTKQLMTILYAKLVVIEVAGWVEMSMDELIKRAGKTIKEPLNIKHLDSQIIQRTYGFEYDKHFRSMLMRVIGLVSVEELEGRLNAGTHAKMLAAINLLKSARDSLAHTYVENPSSGPGFAAPSVAMSYLNDIYAGLKDIETNMKILKLI